MVNGLKITYLKLKNFIGIYSGLGREELEIDFSKSQNRIVMLKGENGSGKTTILSALHPYRETMDGRHSAVREGMNAYKEIHFENDGDVFEVVQLYGSKNKTFIKKNGKELNDNGNIRSGTEIINRELGINKDYFTVGRIGDNITNFVKYKTAQRKDYINTFVPNIDQYLEAYETANNRLSQIKSELNTLKVDINRYDNIDELRKFSQDLKKQISLIHKNIIKAESKKSVLFKSITDLQEESNIKPYELFGYEEEPISEDTDLFTVVSSLYSKYKRENVDTLKDNIDNYLEIHKSKSLLSKDIDTLDVLHSDITGKINDIQRELDLTNAQMDTIKSSLDKANSEMDALQSRLNTIGKDDDSKYQDRLKKTEEELKNISASIKNSPYKNSMPSVEYARRRIETINRLFPLVLNVTGSNNEYIQSLSSVKNITSVYNSEKEEAAALKYEYSGLESDYELLSESTELQNAIDNHDANCSLGENCPFKQYLLKSSTTNKFSTYNEFIEMVNSRSEAIQERLKVIKGHSSEIENYMNALQKLEEYVTENKEYLDLLTEEELNDVTLLDATTLESRQIRDRSVNEAQYLSDVESFKNISGTLEVAKELANSEIINNEHRKEILDNIEKQQEEISKLSDNLQEFKLKYDELESSLSKENKKKSIIDNFVGMQKELVDNTVTMNAAKVEIKRAQDILEKIRDSRKDLIDTEIEIDTLNEQLEAQNERETKVNTDLAVLENMLKNEKVYSSVYKYLAQVVDATHPKKGIPLVFTNIYLEQIRNEANKLLDIAYDGSFVIDFKLDKKEFSIPVTKDDGTVLDDINEGSQGEVAMTNLSLSLSLLSRVSSAYNVVYLDEVDGPLSVGNRAKFMKMLDTQLDALGAEQAFIISHSPNYEAADIDLILLSGNDVDTGNTDYMKGKTVLFDYKN